MAAAVFTQPNDGQAVENPVGGHVLFKVRGEQTSGRVTAFETSVAPGSGPPLHVHANEDETLYVIEGEVRFKVGERLHNAAPGAFVFIPRGIPHAFANVGKRDARMLVHFTPSGMEHFFERFSGLAGADSDTFARLGAETGMTVIGPPLAVSDHEPPRAKHVCAADPSLSGIRAAPPSLGVVPRA
jgi:quercetin dioxygenase-like cupin family protein